MTTQCVVRAAEGPSTAVRDLAPPEQTDWFIIAYGYLVGRGVLDMSQDSVNPEKL